MRKFSLFFCLFILSQAQVYAQFSIKSGDESVIDHRNTPTPPKVEKGPIQTNVVSSNLKTKTSDIVKDDALFELFLFRKETKVLLNLTLVKGDLPEMIVIQKKTSSDISTYSTFKEFTPEEITIIEEDGKIIFEDNYPASRKLDSYYRIMFEYADGAKKINSGVLLPAQKDGQEVFYGDHEQDESLFVNTREKEQDKGISILAERKGSKVNLTLVNNSTLQDGQVVTIERKTSDYLATFRNIRTLSAEEFNQLRDSGQLLLEDKYPPSFKISAKYRVVVSNGEEVLYEFPEVDLINLN